MSLRLRLCLLGLAPFLASAALAKADTCNGVSNNLVTNCGFETGTFAGWSGTTPLNFYSGIDTGDPLTAATTPYQGTYEAYLGSVANLDTLSQTLATTPGEAYSISFALLNDTTPLSPYTNLFQASFGGAVLFTETNTPADAYQLYTLVGTATSTSTPLTFSSQNQTGTFELDSVSVTPAATTTTPVPEPATLALLGTGLLGLVPALRRRLPR